MARRDLIGAENRRQFEVWGTKRVRKMVAAGHYDAEQRRPMLIWVAEKDAKSVKIKRLAIIAGVVITLVGLFVLPLATWAKSGAHF